jgi:hypothetical protein
MEINSMAAEENSKKNLVRKEREHIGNSAWL